MSFFTALADAYGAFGAGRQQRLQNQQDAQRLASETAYQNAQIEQEKTRTAQESKDAQLRAAQAGYDYNTLQPIPLKPGYPAAPKNATPEQLYNWATGNYARALQQNDQQGMAQFGDAITKLSTGYQKETSGDVNVARVPWLQAQTGWWKQRHGEVMAALKAREAEVGEQQSGAMQRAYLSAKTRTDIAGRSDDEREAIAMQTALNLASYHSEDEAYKAAVDEANRTDAQNLAVWKEQNESAARTGGQLTPAPALTPIVVNGGQPGGTNVTVQIVDPRDPTKVRTVTVPNHGAPARAPLQPVGQFLQEARMHGVTDPAQLRRAMKDAGYSPAQINLAVPPPSAGKTPFGDYLNRTLFGQPP